MEIPGQLSFRFEDHPIQWKRQNKSSAKEYYQFAIDKGLSGDGLDYARHYLKK